MDAEGAATATTFVVLPHALTVPAIPTMFATTPSATSAIRANALVLPVVPRLGHATIVETQAAVMPMSTRPVPLSRAWP